MTLDDVASNIWLAQSQGEGPGAHRGERFRAARGGSRVPLGEAVQVEPMKPVLKLHQN
jgi:hypothetical protein